MGRDEHTAREGMFIDSVVAVCRSLGEIDAWPVAKAEQRNMEIL